MKLDQFKDTEPKLALEEFFSGHVEAWGLFEDRFGALKRQFFVDIDGQWDGETLTLREDFSYSDGVKETRVWTIKPMGEGRYEGRADDVIGQADGRAEGNALTWSYQFNLAIGGKKLKVDFRDWFFLQPGGVLVNRAEVTKWGVKLGEANIFFRRADATVGAALGADKADHELLAAQ